MDELIALYEKILKYAGLTTDLHGNVSFSLAGEQVPVSIDGKRLILPYPARLQNINPEKEIVFHPLTESVTNDKSKVIVKLMEVINVRLNYATGMVLQTLLDIVASEKAHGNLSPEQTQLILEVKEASASSVKKFVTHMASRAKKQPSASFVNVFLNRGLNVRGRKYARVGIVTFPMYRELTQGKVANFSENECEMLRRLFRYAFPQIDEAEAYDYGTNTHTGPYLDALLNTSAVLGGCINDMVIQFKEFFPNADELMFDASWTEDFADPDYLHTLARKVPMQRGNEGSTSVEAKRQEEEKAVVQTPVYKPEVQPQPTQQPLPVYQPQVQQAPTYSQPAAKSTGAITYDELRARNNAVGQAYAREMHQQYPQYQHGGFYPQQQEPLPSWAVPPVTQYVQAYDQYGRLVQAPLNQCVLMQMQGGGQAYVVQPQQQAPIYQPGSYTPGMNYR